MKTLIKFLVTLVFGLFMLFKAAPTTSANTASLCYDFACDAISNSCKTATEWKCWDDFQLQTGSGMSCNSSTTCSC